jgi:hypothetical protein
MRYKNSASPEKTDVPYKMQYLWFPQGQYQTTPEKKHCRCCSWFPFVFTTVHTFFGTQKLTGIQHLGLPWVGPGNMPRQ